MILANSFRLRLVLILTAVAAALGGARVAAEETAGGAPAGPDLGPAIGETIPHRLELPDSNGETRAFDSLVGEKGAALFFVRSVDWCPYCKNQAVDVSNRIDEFAARGLSVVFVSYDSPAKQEAFAAKTDFKPVLLSDRDSAAIRSFGLLNESVKESSKAYGIPHPAVFILDTDGVVRAKFYEEDFLTNAKSYSNRPAVDVILAGVDMAAS